MSEDAAERQVIFDAWKKHQSGEKLSQLEKWIVKTVEAHPDYQMYVEDSATYADHEFPMDETDPFAHMALHLMVHEMVAKDQPEGIRSLYDRSVEQHGDKHEVQHKFLEALFDWYVFDIGDAGEEPDVDLDDESVTELGVEFLVHVANYVDNRKSS